MDCQSALHMLEQHFDENSTFSPELEQHLLGCAECRVKAKDLERLEILLGDLPFDAPNDIEDRVMSAITKELSQRNRPALVGVISVFVFLCVSALNWLLPMQELYTKGWNHVRTWIPDTEWLGSGRSYREQFEMSWSKGLSMIEGVEWFSSSVVWSTLITAVVLFMILNGICAVQLRHISR